MLVRRLGQAAKSALTICALRVPSEPDSRCEVFIESDMPLDFDFLLVTQVTSPCDVVPVRV